MTYRTQNARLMRRLGFVADSKDKPQVCGPKLATYWRHQPTRACVVTFHTTRYTEADIVRSAISAGIMMALREATDKVGSALRSIGNDHEQQAYTFGQERRARVKSL